MPQLVKVSKEQMGGKFIEDLHKSIFGDSIPADYFRYDSCLITQDDDNNLVSYVLIREISSETIELGWGGTSKDSRGILSKISLDLFTQECLNHYENVTLQTCNKNLPMLRLALSLGYIVVGCRVANNGELFVILNKGRE